MDAVDPMLADLRRHVNDTRYRPDTTAGHYESFFVRANHSTRPLACWIRYTLFSPRHHSEQAQGELWAIAFDGETGRHVAVKQELPLAACTFDPDRFNVRIGASSLDADRLMGVAHSHAHTIRWDLTYRGQGDASPSAPLFLLPRSAYAPRARLSPAKSLVGLPLAVFSGTLVVDDVPLPITDWVGSQNHNWGTRHTDHYAWGQVAGFDHAPSSFLEVTTARRRIGPLWSPFLTLLVLRHAGVEYALNSPAQLWRNRGRFEPFAWNFHAETRTVRLAGRISAPPAAWVGWTYRNPPGGVKYCLNTKLAACQLTLTHRVGSGWGPPEHLTTAHRAAFEILSDQPDARVPLQV